MLCVVVVGVLTVDGVVAVVVVVDVVVGVVVVVLVVDAVTLTSFTGSAPPLFATDKAHGWFPTTTPNSHKVHD